MSEVREPDGWFWKDLIVFCEEEISKQTVISKGFYLDIPDISSSSSERLDELNLQLMGLLGTVDDSMAMQIQWSVDSDYHEELENYHRITKEKTTNAWSAFVRAERYGTFVGDMQRKSLRRERLAIFLSRKCSSIPKKGLHTKDDIDRYLAQQSKSFDDKMAVVEMIMPDSRVRVMTDQDHYFFYKSFLNPSMSRSDVPRDRRYINFDPGMSILQQTLPSDCIFQKLDECVAFRLDNHFHALIVIRKWPQGHRAGMMADITRSLGMDFCITQNVYPLKVQAEISKEEKVMPRLRGEATHGGRYSAWTEIAQKEAKINSLMMGNVLPYNVLTVIRVWDRTADGLHGKLSVINTALENMAGTRSHTGNHPFQTKSLFFETFPGWTGGKNRAWDIYAESDYLADLMPATSTYTGDLDAGEAIYHGAQGGMVGIKTFSGTTPQHTLVLGMRGAGKSALMVDLLSQTEPFFDYTAIIEEGNSYGAYTKTMGSEPIIIHENSNLTFNYFDTLQLPLTTENISNASRLALRMVGVNESEDTNNYRTSIITGYIQRMYWDVFQDWRNRNEDQMESLNRMAFAVNEYRLRKLPTNSSFLDGFTSLLEWERERPDEASAFEQQFTDEEILGFTKNPQTMQMVRDLAFARFTPEEYPTHSQLLDVMSDPFSDHDESQVYYIRTMLSAWSRFEGNNGVLFDGPTNFRLGEKIDHFELGSISNEKKALKGAVGFLLSNFVRQAIVRRPRAMRKRKIIEEASKFLDIPGGDQMLAEDYAQMRKYGCWIAAISQQIEQLMGTSLWPVIAGNSVTKLLLRQNNQRELLSIAREIGLPDMQADAILNYPLPEHIKRGRKFSSATYITDTVMGANCGTLRSFASDEMLYISESEGEKYDLRAKELAQYEDPTMGVIAECEKRRNQRQMAHAA